MIHNVACNGHRSTFVVDRIELVEQAASHLHALGLKVGIMQGDNTRRHPDDEVVVASIQTVRSRGAPPSGFIIIDEAHILHRTHIQLMEDWNLATFIGLSATPLRPDLGQYFTNLVRGPSVQWLTDQGFLVPVRAYCPSAAQLDNLLIDVHVKGGNFVERELETILNRKELVGDIITTWTDKAEGRPTLVFAINIAHSKSVIDDFLAEGVDAAHLDAYTPREERKEVIDAFRAGQMQVLSSVNVLGIGFDVPDASCGIDRPSRSSDVSYRDGRLVEYGSEGGESAGPTLSDKRSWYQAYLWNAERQGHKKAWAFYAYQEKFRESPPREWAHLPGVEPTGEQARWITSYYIRYAWRKRA
jgi:superfamily II DNA or RNA helicase